MSHWRSAVALPLLAAAAALIGACSHDIESPPVKSSSVTPDLVCTEEKPTTVALAGSGFTPMPASVLAVGADGPDGGKSPELLLPSVTLNFSQPLLPMGPAGGSQLYPGNPTATNADLLHWTSESQMSFQVTPDLMLTPGLYDVVVTNPDGKQTATFKGGLAAVPRPIIKGVQPDILCDAEHDQTVTLSGTTFLQVGTSLPKVHVAPMSGTGGTDFTVTVDPKSCTPVPGTHAEGVVDDCTSASFVIPKGTFMPGAYTVTLTNPAPADCHSTDPITITIVPPPSVATVVPDLVCDAEGSETVTVNGTGFIEFTTGGMNALPQVAVGSQTYTPTMMSGCTPITGTFVEGMAETCTSMTITIMKGDLPVTGPMAFPVVVTNPPPADCHSLETVNLELVPPPSVTASNPLAVCDAQGNQNVTIDGMNFLELTMGSTTTLPSVTIGTMAFTPSTATGCMPIAGTFAEGMVSECTGLVVTVPQGTFTPGTYPVSVANPKPADCSSMEMVTLKVDPPPVVTGTAPKTICQGGGNLTVTGSNFTQNASVSLESMGQPTIMSASSMVNMAGTQINATFPGGFTVGSTYDVVVDDGDGCTDAPPHQQVTVVTGPIAFYADPDIVFNGINTQVTIYLTALMPPATVTMTPAGSTSPVTMLTVTADPVANHGNRIQAIVPSGTAPGSYDLHVTDGTGCPTTLPAAITVTGTLSVAIKSIVPSFGWNQQETPVSVLRNASPPPTMNAPFVATPRVFLNPSPNQPAGNGCPALPTAIQIQSVSFVDQNTLTAVVPKGQPTCLYDLVVVNPDKTVGELPSAFTVQSAEPPTITSVTPASIAASTGQNVVVSGTGFNGSKISASCVNAAAQPISPPPNVTSGAVACTASGCTQAATIDGSAVGNGGLCVIRVTNADGSYFDYSAVGVTTPAGKLPGTTAGPSLNVARRALVAAAGNATSSARFVYAIGGDGGAAMASAPFSSTEFAPVDLFGNMGAWKLQPASTLGTARSYVAYATAGRYIYVAGGFDGTSPLASAERAMILSPLEAPGLDIDDLVPATTGLDPGYWMYRVSATFSANDPDNPGGESLASDEFIVKVPAFAGKKIQVVLAWTAPVDALGVPLPNVAGYNVYRTPMVDGASGGEVLLATVGATSSKYTDDGSGTPGTQKPLPLGSTGKWAQLPAMSAARKGAGGAAGFDPVKANQLYFYALLGLGQGNTALTSYEYLTITLQPNGHQTVGAWTTGASASSAGRWQLSGFVADSVVSSAIPADTTYVYLGQGVSAGGASVATIEAGKIASGGDLGALNNTIKSFGGTLAGYGALAANDNLYAFGGLGAAPSQGAKFSGISATPPAVGTWVDEGIQLVTPRYLMGSSVQSGFIFLVGGDAGGGVGSKTTETVIW